MKKQIIFDFTPYVYGRAAGYNEYTMSLLFGISKSLPTWCEITLLIRSDQREHFSLFSTKMKIKEIHVSSVIQRILWQNLILPFYKNSDFFIFTGNFAPIFFKKPYALVTHDLNFLHFPNNFSFLGLIYRKFFIKRSIKKSKISITISKQIRSEIFKEYNISSKVIYNPIPPPKLSRIKTTKSIVCASSLAKHKNIINAYNACKAFTSIDSEVNVFFIGNWNICDFPVENTSRNIHLLGYISEEEKNVLFSQAKCILCPSIYEGFGMPYIEAILYRKILVCSDIPIAHEIAGDNAIYIAPPYSTSEILDSLMAMDLNNNCHNLPFDSYVEKFDPHFIASQYLEVIFDHVQR